jgi:hypothetical protein
MLMVTASMASTLVITLDKDISLGSCINCLIYSHISLLIESLALLPRHQVCNQR